MTSVLVGDCRALMAEMADASVDAIVTDPPYELGFMGKKWDASGIAYDGEVWRQALRVLKPGGHLLAFGGTRTYHRMTCAIEDAGFEIRDCIQWLYGSGFPKSLNVEKATGDAAWSGWGTALKPACEPIVVARKPLIGTVAANVLAHGTGGLNIDACRIGTAEDIPGVKAVRRTDYPQSHKPGQGPGWGRSRGGAAGDEVNWQPTAGRWPANVVLDPEAAAMLDAQSGVTVSNPNPNPNPNPNFKNAVFGRGMGGVVSAANQHSDSGGASRFFYVAKPSRSERDAGIGGEARPTSEVTGRDPDSAGAKNPRAGMTRTARRNLHPTVKPVDLMEWLVRLVTPPGGLVLDPFTGSGSTGCAAVRQGFRFVGCELDPVYARFARLRIRLAVNAPKAAPLRATGTEADPNQLTMFLDSSHGA